ncbi:MAG TPA: hypothetical protein VHZ55_21060 [Bryobacteraceae bacterium]|jgi:hypothetical protein|nr:hypothetical protein [Bryobacteraceae bacterium]
MLRKQSIKGPIYAFLGTVREAAIDRVPYFRSLRGRQSDLLAPNWKDHDYWLDFGAHCVYPLAC